MAETSPFEAVCQALSRDVSKEFPCTAIEHIDITCDGCETEPIVGRRYKCQTCEDIDLCETCMRALIAARVQMSKEGGPVGEPPLQSQRPKRWISKLKSEDGRVKWGALQQAVPCLHPSHPFLQVICGPERALVLYLHKARSSGEAETQRAVDTFLGTFLPSRAACSDVAFLVADVHPPQPDAASTEARVEAALEQWEQITSKRRPTAEDVGALARRHRIRRGKWLAFPKTQEEADAAWAAVVRAAAGGLLGSCCQVKVSSTNPREEGYVLMAYTEDYLDQEAVAATADALRCALPRLRDPRLLYKADIFTFLGIYAKNEYNLKPTVYTAQL